MRTTRVLAIIAILGIAFSFRASANVVYDSETTNKWFAVDMSTLKAEDLKTSPWKSPKDGEATVASAVIKLDTDLDDPLTYTAAQASEAVAIVAAEMTATVNASVPDMKDVPQAALCVIGTASATNWVGLVGNGNDGTNWVTFPTPVPVAGRTYSVRIEFDQRQGQRKIRYRVGDTVLGGDDGWYPNPKTTAANIQSVSFSGTGDISGLGGSNVVANAATFNGVGYTTFANALAAAKAAGTGWNDTNPIKLFQDVAYTVTESCVLYVNPNGKAFTINGEVVTKTSGNYTYTVKTKNECEAYIGSTYYITFEEAVEAAGANDVIVVNTPLTKDLSITKSLGINPDGKLTCSTLTVGNGVTFNLAGNLSVQTATINGSVTGTGTLTVTGTLTGVNVAKLVLGDNAKFVYGSTALGPSTALTLGTALKIGGLGSAAIDTVVIDNAAINGKDVSMFTANPALPEGLMLDVDGKVLKVVKEPPAIEITIDEDTAGFDFTNGEVNVTTTVRPGKSGKLTLKVYDFNGGIREAVDQKVDGSTTKVSWNLNDLTAGGTYSYEIVINDGSKDIGTAHGEFTAANWDDDIWFGADASKATREDREKGGSWETEPTIDSTDKVYVIEEDSVFNVAVEKQGQGSNRVTRVDAKVTFESLVDGEVDEPKGNVIGGFVATTEGWKALTAGAWVTLTGDLEPVAGKPYVIRAEVDFISDTKRVRYLVSEDDGANFFPLSNGTAQWINLAAQNKSLLAQVELQGSGKLAKFEATVADKAIAAVDGVKYDTMDEALEAAGTNGEHEVTLLTNATIEPTKPGSYDIAPGGHYYVSGGTVSTDPNKTKTIVITEPGQPPVVRPSTEVMNNVKTPDGAQYKDINLLRAFLERNGVTEYQNENATAESITTALQTIPQDQAANGLALWQDYALGVDKDTPVAPVAIPTGDTATDGITLAIPAVDPAKYSKDYDITYKVGETTAPDAPQSIKIPLGTGAYSIKAVFTPKN